MALTGKCFIAVLAALLVAAAPASAARGFEVRRARPAQAAGKQLAAPAQVDFDYFVYTMTWPGTFCESQSCEKKP